MAKYCPECGNKALWKMMAYLLPFRVCLACGNASGFFVLPYAILLAPIEALFGKGSVNLMAYVEEMSYWDAVKVYLSTSKEEE